MVQQLEDHGLGDAQTVATSHNAICPLVWLPRPTLGRQPCDGNLQTHEPAALDLYSNSGIPLLYHQLPSHLFFLFDLGIGLRVIG